MKLIVGFGNPGNQYNFTRHNVGFLALDFYFKVKNLKFENSPKFNAEYAKFTISDLNIPTKTTTSTHSTSSNEQVIFIKPQTFYNNQGQAVAVFKNFYKIDLKDILVLCDDFNLSFGTLRFREKGTDGGNNGLKSVIGSLSTTDFARLRLGTANDNLRRKIGDTDFVLSRFTEEEKSNLPQVLNETVKRIDDFLVI